MAAMDASPISQPTTPTSAGIKRRHSPSLSLDLSDLPALTTPSNPSNTLIITNLADPAIFQGSNLQAIRDAISAQAPLHTFSPLKSFRRIIAVFHTIADATHVRQLLDGESVLNNRIRVYFGEPTALEEKDQHLAAPKSSKLFFISPPPSPPMGWEMRNEEPPNKDVHADDLVDALHKLSAVRTGWRDDGAPPSPTSVRSGSVQRSRSSTLVFDPTENGGSPGLPAINVEDTGFEEDEATVVGSPMEVQKTGFAHTSRPPVELMEH